VALLQYFQNPFLPISTLQYIPDETGDKSFFCLLDNSDQSGSDADRLALFFKPTMLFALRLAAGDFGMWESNGLSDFAPTELFRTRGVLRLLLESMP
jgi:hypothetical protein